MITSSIDLGFLPGGTFLVASAISRDGLTVVGYGNTLSDDGITMVLRAFKWTESTGFVLFTSTEKVDDPVSIALSVSDDGNTIVGEFRTNGSYYGFIWNSITGFFNLNNLDTGLTINSAIIITGDGNYVTGTGTIDFIPNIPTTFVFLYHVNSSQFLTLPFPQNDQNSNPYPISLLYSGFPNDQNTIVVTSTSHTVTSNNDAFSSYSYSYNQSVGIFYPVIFGYEVISISDDFTQFLCIQGNSSYLFDLNFGSPTLIEVEQFLQPNKLSPDGLLIGGSDYLNNKIYAWNSPDIINNDISNFTSGIIMGFSFDGSKILVNGLGNSNVVVLTNAATIPQDPLTITYVYRNDSNFDIVFNFLSGNIDPNGYIVTSIPPLVDAQSGLSTLTHTLIGAVRNQSYKIVVTDSLGVQSAPFYYNWIPGFDEPYDKAYNEFSVKSDRIKIPDHFNIYSPDNNSDYNCVSIISPSLEKGASKWTQNNKWITIGIYRDEGRLPSSFTPEIKVNWSRIGSVYTFNDVNHNLSVGDLITTYNESFNGIDVLIQSIIDDNNFTFLGVDSGQLSGNNRYYQQFQTRDYFNDFRVFRLLPSFQLISFTEFKQILLDTAPIQKSSRTTLFNITSNSSVKIPTGNNQSVNYELVKTKVKEDKNLSPRFGQVYDETGKTLELKYSVTGYPTKYFNVDSIYKNDQIFYSNLEPINHIAIYDYYGFPINDTTRSPYHSISNIVKNNNIQGDINNLSKVWGGNQGGLYVSTLNDAHGNLVIGVKPDNSLVVRKQILPLELDPFNRPIKKPL